MCIRDRLYTRMGCTISALLHDFDFITINHTIDIKKNKNTFYVQGDVYNSLSSINLKEFDILYGAAGHPNASFKISFTDLQKITSGKIMDITE